jgi:hypothetical protein
MTPSRERLPLLDPSGRGWTDLRFDCLHRQGHIQRLLDTGSDQTALPRTSSATLSGPFRRPPPAEVTGAASDAAHGLRTTVSGSTSGASPPCPCAHPSVRRCSAAPAHRGSGRFRRPGGANGARWRMVQRRATTFPHERHASPHARRAGGATRWACSCRWWRRSPACTFARACGGDAPVSIGGEVAAAGHPRVPSLVR